MLVTLFAAAGCGKEVGGDGFVPDPPSAGNGGLPSSVGGSPEGGASNVAGGGKASMGGKGGRGGSSGRAGAGGRGGQAGTRPMPEGGMGGDPDGAVCGNGVTEPSEECDDGNTKSGDGCSATCKSACEICEKTFCKAVQAGEAGEHNANSDDPLTASPDLYTDCYQMPGQVGSGPAAGQITKSEACRAMVDCIRTEQCAQFVPPERVRVDAERNYTFLHCFCSYDLSASNPNYLSVCKDAASFDPKTDPNYIGKCKREIHEASQYDNLGSVLLSPYTRKSSPLGGANNLLQWCDQRLCAEECLPETSAGVVATITADILATKNAAGESAVGDLIADALRAATASDLALVQNAVFSYEYAARGLIYNAAPRPADAPGRVLESEVRGLLLGFNPQVANVQVQGQRLVTLKLTGRQVYDLLQAQWGQLQVSGLTWSWDAATSNVTEVRKNDAPIDKAASYSVTVIEPLAKLITGATEVVVTDKNAVEEFVKYLKAQPQPVAPPALNRITRLN